MSTRPDFLTDLSPTRDYISKSLLEIKKASIPQTIIFSSIPSLAKYLLDKNIIQVQDYLLIRGLISEINNSLLELDDFVTAKNLVIERLEEVQKALINNSLR